MHFYSFSRLLPKAVNCSGVQYRTVQSCTFTTEEEAAASKRMVSSRCLNVFGPQQNNCLVL